MHIDLFVVLASAVVGLLVGLTGVGGGALMTPMLVMLFGVAPSVAITSDLVAALFMRPWGVAVHWRRKSVNTTLVRYLCYGSLPSALLGAYTLRLMGHHVSSEHRLDIVLGAALIVGAMAMLARSFTRTRLESSELALKKKTTIAIGALGGFMVGLTSVGAGSLVLVLLVFAYPGLRNDQLVGTDLAQSVPLTMSATLGTLAFNHVDVALTTSLIIGSVPAVIVGALLSSRSNGVVLRGVIAAAVLLSGLKYVGLPGVALGVVAFALLVGLSIVGLYARTTRQGTSALDSVAETV